MGRRLTYWQIGGFFFTAVAGALLHFVYQWSGRSALAGVVGAVNESTWEHMKLLFVPMFLLTLVQIWSMGKAYPNLLACRAASVTVGLAAIPVVFYTFTGVVGHDVGWVSIGIFYVAAAAAFYLDGYLLRRGKLSRGWMQIGGLIWLWALAFLFVWCTFFQPRLGLWQDPVTKAFGIPV